jgi:ABC-type oligopeptide transport system substrate-binding subunit
LVLVLDDLQWADAGSISLLFHLGRHLAGNRILVVGAYRPEQVALGRDGQRHPLEAVLNEFQRRCGDITVNLGQGDSRGFVEDFLDTEPNRLGVAFREMLCRQTRGHPLFTVELLRGMQERGDLIRDCDGRWVEGPALDWETLPPKVEAVIAERIGRLDEPLQAALRAASVEGEAFTAEVVARVQAVDEGEMVTSLSGELDRRHRLLRAQGILRIDGQRLSTYRFRHMLYRKFLYNSLDPVERAHLHEDVGNTLEALYGGQVGATAAIAGQLAWHFQEAGIAGKAITYLTEAGDRARGLYAYQEAIGLYERAVALLKEEGDHERTARTRMKLGLTYHSALDFQRSQKAYQEAFVLWQRVGEVPAGQVQVAPHPLRIGWNHRVTLDPGLSGDTSALVLQELFSSLVELTWEGEILPDVASSWEVSEGGRRYVFHLRDDVRWSDGTSVTALDFEFAWKRVLDPATASPNAGLLYDVQGARAYHQGLAADPDTVAIRALDDFTLEVRLEGPTGYFLHLLSLTATCPVPRHVAKAHGATWPEAEPLVSNGPFLLDSYQHGERLVLVRNPYYHGRFTGNLGQVELHLFQPDEQTGELEEYAADGLDVARLQRALSEEMQGARHAYAGEYVLVPAATTYFLALDVACPPFDDRRVRRAFGLALDREALLEKALGGSHLPATGGFLPPTIPGHSPGIALDHDPERARQLLAEAGYRDGDGFPVVRLLVMAGRQVTMEHVRAQWEDTLGVVTELHVMEWAEYLDKAHNDPPHVFLMGWIADYADPDCFLRVGLRLYSRWTHAVYDRLVERARRVTDQQERTNLYKEADRVLVEEAAILPLSYEQRALLVKPWVKRYPVSDLFSFSWKDVIIDPH